jgi:hypothetical protein
MKKLFRELKETIICSLEMIGQSVQSGNWQ